MDCGEGAGRECWLSSDPIEAAGVGGTRMLLKGLEERFRTAGVDINGGTFSALFVAT